MIVGENMFVMLLVEKFFKTFTKKKEITDTAKNTEAIVALSAQSREEVNQMMNKVLEAGGRMNLPDPRGSWMDVWTIF